MANFCGKCGTKLDTTTGLCPTCDAMKLKKHTVPSQAKQKADKKTIKQQKYAERSTSKKTRRFFTKALLIIVFLAVFAVGSVTALVCLGIIRIPFFTNINEQNLLKIINEQNISVEQKSIVMENETQGTATIVVKIPDYTILFDEALQTENPEQYLSKTLFLKQYDSQEVEISANVTVENGKTIVHEEEAVQQVLEEALVDAINTLSEVKQ